MLGERTATIDRLALELREERGRVSAFEREVQVMQGRIDELLREMQTSVSLLQSEREASGELRVGPARRR